MLENEYRPMQNAHAIKRLANPQTRPDVKLAIGDDEVKESQPILVFVDAYANMHNHITMDNSKQAIENTGTVGDGNTVVQDDFLIENFWLGDAIEVI